MPAIELAIQDLAGAHVARDMGVERVELCAGLALGGLTPSIGMIEHVVRSGVEAHVLIRPRAGGFLYSSAEVGLMEAEITHAVAAGAAGVVIGVLDDAGYPYIDHVHRFVALADGVDVTFHRAIDVTVDPVAAVEMLRGSGVKRILTSGGAPSAAEGSATLARMVQASGEELQIQAGGGITPANVAEVVASGVDAIHFSAKRHVDDSPSPMGRMNFGGYDATDAQVVQAIMNAVGHTT